MIIEERADGLYVRGYVNVTGKLSRPVNTKNMLDCSSYYNVKPLFIFTKISTYFSTVNFCFLIAYYSIICYNYFSIYQYNIV